MDMQQLYEIFLQHPHISTDTRKIIPGSIFFALKGPNFDGNEFLENALQQGAAFCVSDSLKIFDNPRVIRVEDTLATLQQLAKHHRQQLNIPVIAITGSNGKTTTKELVHAVLSTTYKICTTVGNLNNHIGVPLTLLSIKKDAEIAVIEMGANHQKEIESYCTYTLPTHGLITNCGKAHLEGFGGVEGVKKGKGELFDFIRSVNGTIFMYSGYDYLEDMSKNIQNRITYGITNAQYSGTILPSGEFLTVQLSDGPKIKTHLVGDYNFPNVMAAVAIGKTFSIPEEKIIEALEAYIPSNSRSQMIEKNGNKIILDAYNANPTSMKAAVENFSNINGENKILILGAMKELGDDTAREHADLICEIQKSQWRKVVLVGKEFENVPEDMLHFHDASAVKAWMNEQRLQNYFMLIKGSRSMQLEKILE